MAAKETASLRPFVERISEAPSARNDARTVGAITALKERARADASLAPLSAALEDPRVAKLLAGIFSGSPYLDRPHRARSRAPEHILTTAPEARLAELKAELASAAEGSRDARRGDARAARVQERGGAADGARRSRRRVAGAQEVTAALTECADAAVQAPSTSCFARRRHAANGWPRDGRQRRAQRLHRARHGQVRRRRAQLFERHRSHRLLRPRPHRTRRRASSRKASSCA